MQTQPKQIPLITSKLKGSKIQYQVQKQGILFLRKIKNKKFRILFNVIPPNKKHYGKVKDYQHFLQAFNQNILNSNNKNEHEIKNTQKQQFTSQENQFLPSLKIHPEFKQISNDRVIIVMNCLIFAQFSPLLLILGYLVSSFVIHHNFSQKFSAQSPLTNVLSEFKKLMRRTNIDQLNEKMKAKTGCQKNPQFLCLVNKNQKQGKNDKEYELMLNDFYRLREQEQHSKINCALQALVDYFPQRSSFGIQVIQEKEKFRMSQNGIMQVKGLGKKIGDSIKGRQLLSYEFSYSTIQSLIFQLCSFFNKQEQKLDLVAVYKNVLQTKKARFQIESIQKFFNIIQEKIFLSNKIQLSEISALQQGQSILPVGENVLRNMMDEIKETLRMEMLWDATNCMAFQEYLEKEKKITEKIKQQEKKLFKINQQMGKSFVKQSYDSLKLTKNDIQLVSQNQGQQIQIQELKEGQLKTQQLEQFFKILAKRLESYQKQCSSLFTQGDRINQNYSQSFKNLSLNYFEVIKAKIVTTFQKINKKLALQQNCIQTLTQEYNKSIKQKQSIQQKYELQIMIEAELKQQIQSLILSSSINSHTQNQHIPTSPYNSTSKTLQYNELFISTQKDIQKLKQKVQFLENELKQKNNHINHLTSILNKFEVTSKSLPDNKLIDHFSAATKFLIDEANLKMKSFYNILDQVKSIQAQYENAKKLLIKQKNLIVEEKISSLKEINSAKQLTEKLNLQNQKLYQIITEEKKTLQLIKNLKETLNQNIVQLQAANTELTCSLAEQQSDKQLYRKALCLVIENTVKGKSQNLSKFYKFLQHQQIKELIKPIISKK